MGIFSYKIFKQGEDTLLAISDKSIIGKTFKEGNLILSVNKTFYHDKVADKKKVLKIIESATIINAVGEEIINILVSKNLIKQDSILFVEGIPHAQIVNM